MLKYAPAGSKQPHLTTAGERLTTFYQREEYYMTYAWLFVNGSKSASGQLLLTIKKNLTCIRPKQRK